MTKFEELKERYPNLIPVQELRANVSIIELAIQHGFEPQLHKGHNRPVLEHPTYNDVIIIKNPQDAAQQVYQRGGDFTDSGTIIDFIRNRLSTVFATYNRPGEHEFKNITSVLYDYLRIDPTQVNQNRLASSSISTTDGTKQQFAREQFDIRPLEPDNYLTRREIAPQTLDRSEFVNKVVSQVSYFDPRTGHTENFMTVREHPERHYLQFNNVAFPYYNGLSSEIMGLELRNEKIKLHAPGSDRYGSVFISNTPPVASQFFVMESAIDALSHQQLRSIKGDTAFNAVYFSTGGQITPEQVNTITRYIGSFEKTPDWKISLNFDNDTKGHRFDLQFIQQLTATKFPMSSTVGGINRMSYLLPEQESYRPIQEALLQRVDLFNKNVQAQFGRTDQDTLGQKELTSQQITISRSGSQVALSIPESCPALTAVCKYLLELTGLSQRIGINKACAKDLNEDLVRDVRQGERYRFSIKDESGRVLMHSSVATVMNRTLNHYKHQAEGEGLTKVFTLSESQPFGFHKVQAEVKVVNGQTVSATLTPDFEQKLVLEKNQRSEQTLSPDNKPQPSDDQPKLRLR